jgi:hypothetical protein
MQSNNGTSGAPAANAGTGTGTARVTPVVRKSRGRTDRSGPRGAAGGQPAAPDVAAGQSAAPDAAAAQPAAPDAAAAQPAVADAAAAQPAAAEAPTINLFGGGIGVEPDGVELRPLICAADGDVLCKSPATGGAVTWDGEVRAGAANPVEAAVSGALACLRYWNQLQSLTSACRWSEARVWLYLQTGCQGKLARLRDNAANLAEYQAQLERWYLTGIRAADLTRPLWNDLTQRGRPVQEYLDDCSRLWRLLADVLDGTEESTLVAHWVAGLDYEWQVANQVLAVSFQQAMRWADLDRLVIQGLRYVIHPAAARKHPETPGPGAAPKVPAPGKAPSEATKPPGKKDVSQIRCYKCNQLGHKRNECPN